METYAPIFSGFYETAYSFNVDHYDVADWLFDENEYNDIQMEFLAELVKRHYDDIVKENYKEYCDDVAKAVCEFLTEKVSEMLNTKVEFEFQSIYSPKYYNYRNDSINVNFNCDADAFMKNLLEYIKKHLDDFKEYIESNYTSYDGFMSYYSNDVNDWLKNEYNDHEIGSLLEFALRSYYDDIETDMIYFSLENVYACSYIELADKFKLIADSNELKAIFNEFERLETQKKNYYEYCKSANRIPNTEAIEEQTEKNNAELCKAVIDLMKK